MMKNLREKKKIVLIGPVYPYKGGISHYTGLLYKALVQEGHEVSMHSFRFQYPKFLYKKEQKDERDSKFKIENTNYSIHTLNPFNWIGAARKIKKEAPDLVVIQWWHPYFAPCYFFLCKLFGRQKILFVCHNVFPHERFPMDRFLTKMVLRQGGFFIVQSHMDAGDLLSVKADASYVATPHPTYNAFKMKDLSKEEARNLLQIQEKEKVMLFFGFVREYKGLKHLLEAMKEITNRMQDIQLWIVGDFGSDRETYMNQIHSLELEDNIKIVEGYIADSEVEKYFAACNLVVLPYISATQSGIVQIAYGFQKPVLVTDVGGLPDVVTHQRTGYVVEPGAASAIADAVCDYFTQDKEEEFAGNIAAEAERFSWGTFVKRLEDLAWGK